MPEELLGDDCALDMTDVASLCNNLDAYVDWYYASCRGGGRGKLNRLAARCNKIRTFL